MTAEPPNPSPPPRKPLSMAWVAAAIGCFVVIHTVVNLAYRKPGPAHEPVAEARERHRKFVQADMKGWTRYAAWIAPAGSSDAFTRAEIARGPTPPQLATALPFDLVGIFTRDPRLHPAPTRVSAPAELAPDAALRVRLDFERTIASPGLGEALAFAKDHHLYLFLQDATRTVLDDPPIPLDAAMELALPPGVLAAGNWTVSLYAAETEFTWTCHVPPAPSPATPTHASP